MDPMGTTKQLNSLNDIYIYIVVVISPILLFLVAFGNTPLDIEFTVGDHTHVLFTTGRFVFSGWFRCVARTVKGMEDSVRPVPWKWHGIDANARQSGSILLWREAEFRIGWHCDACCCYGHMSRADSFDGWIRTSGPSPWWRSQKPSSMCKWCCRTTELWTRWVLGEYSSCVVSCLRIHWSRIRVVKGWCWRWVAGRKYQVQFWQDCERWNFKKGCAERLWNWLRCWGHWWPCLVKELLLLADA